MTHARQTRHAFTFVELMVAAGVLAVLGVAIVQLTGTGWRRIESTERKLTAAKRSHDRIEELRGTLATARWAWVVPPPDEPTAKPEDGSPLIYVGRAVKSPGPGRPKEKAVEVAYDRDAHELAISGKAVPGALDEVRFVAAKPHFVKLIVRTDEASAATGLAHREKSTLVTGVYLQAQAEEEEFEAFAWEEDHPWCTRGKALHAGFIEPQPAAP
jgi:hypothetical protein